MKVFWQYYRTITLYNILFSVLLTVITGNIYWLPVLFCTFGIGAGILAFDYYFKHQYYFYNNQGYNRQKLTLTMLGINVCIALPVLAIILLVS